MSGIHGYCGMYRYVVVCRFCEAQTGGRSTVEYAEDAWNKRVINKEEGK